MGTWAPISGCMTAQYVGATLVKRARHQPALRWNPEKSDAQTVARQVGGVGVKADRSDIEDQDT